MRPSLNVRRTLAIVSAITLLAGAAMLTAAAQTRTLRFVSPIRPPFTEVQGKPRFALDLVEEALKRVNVTATTTIVPSGEYGQLLLTGPYDGTAVGWPDTQRQQEFLLSQPYLENRLVLVARRGKQWVIGLPGNPVSSYLTAFLFLLPLLRALAGAHDPLPRRVTARLGAALPGIADRTEFVRARVDGDSLVPLSEQDSSALVSLACAHALIERPANSRAVEAGELVEAFWLQNGGVA